MWRTRYKQLMWVSVGAMVVTLLALFGYFSFQGKRRIKVQIRNESSASYFLVQKGGVAEVSEEVSAASTREIYLRAKGPATLTLRSGRHGIGAAEWQLEGYIEPNERGTIYVLIRTNGDVAHRRDLKLGLF